MFVALHVMRLVLLVLSEDNIWTEGVSGADVTCQSSSPLSIVLQCLEVLSQLCVPAGYGSKEENVALLMFATPFLVCMRRSG